MASVANRHDPCLYLSAPRDPDAVPWCGLGFRWPEHCAICEQYEASWAPPDTWIADAWRRVTGR
jgi:hypothetical protein